MSQGQALEDRHALCHGRSLGAVARPRPAWDLAQSRYRILLSYPEGDKSNCEGTAAAVTFKSSQMSRAAVAQTLFSWTRRSRLHWVPAAEASACEQGSPQGTR